MQYRPGHVSTAATALIRPADGRVERAPWLRYNPQIFASAVPEFDGTKATWDIVTRAIQSVDHPWDYKIVFQLAASRGPHESLVVGLNFDLCEGPRRVVWTGQITSTAIQPRDPSYWYRREGFWIERYG